jgi:predicted CXXCH cytochrome family protein
MEQKSQKLPVWLLVAGACVLLVGTLFLGVQMSSAQPKKPEHQPIDFYHYVHTKEQKIDCLYCHRTAETADYAGMPSTQLCMGCHRSVIPQYPEVWKVRSYWELGEGIPWKRVNQLPDHVYFSHKAHTVVGKLGCATCHGQLENMAGAMQTVPLTMGWCLKCHEQPNPTTQKQTASTECSACHR